jgi:small-conductance mechanosensitive channel
LAWTRILGLTIPEWITLGISLLTLLLAYLAGTLLIRRVLPSLTRRTPTELDDRILEKVSPNLRWLVVLVALDLATGPLTFLGADLKQLLGDIYFVLFLLVGLHALWRLIDVVAGWYRERATEADREKELAPFITLMRRLAHVVLAIIGLSALLSHFGVNVAALAAALGLGALGISLAARDTIADAIAGFIILVDQPFRIGDRIEVEKVGTWGEVVDIGLRTTRIRTWKNRMVIVPNSHIGQNQVINYSYPDPRFLVDRRVGIAYGTNVETARQIIIDTVRQVEGVLLDKPVQARYDEMGESAMIFRVGWWVASVADERPVVDRVNTALQEALSAAGIEMPPDPGHKLSLQV